MRHPPKAASLKRSGLVDLIARCGGTTVMSDKLGIREPGIYHWTQVPDRHVHLVSEMSGIPAHELRPDLFSEPAADHLSLCSCGAPATLFSPGREAITGPGGILVQRGIPTIATCLTCHNRGRPTMAYNGPDKAAFNDTLAEYTEIKFNIMKWTSKAGHLKNRWEQKGGEFDEIQHGYRMGQLTPAEQRAKISSRSRVEGWLGIATVTEEDGQISFTAAFDQKPDDLGAGGAPLGSRLSLARAATDGYNTGRRGGSLADCPFSTESEEAHKWAEAYGDGMRDRPEKPIKPPKAAKPETDEMAELAASMPRSEAEQNLVSIDRARRRRTRPLPAPESDEDLPPAIA